ncbi:hypothetical protein QP324_09020 [Corynebacterium sp. UMB0012]|uniref:hypothetical protein n=1 Tax=Corynebacterium sp. UMB0012 TaxID=3046344 RepID=UPI00254EAF0F|nr:hypothetical protein [Corynebacterium sp. UMB0012]MDK7048715.1 hypothetical protein [Corynebacterium sp. UMB0012]
MSFEFRTYEQIHYRVETSQLSSYTHDMLFWPANGSIQNAHVHSVVETSDTRAWLAADSYAAFMHDEILDWCESDRRAVQSADLQLQRDLYCA